MAPLPPPVTQLEEQPCTLLIIVIMRRARKAGLGVLSLRRAPNLGTSRVRSSSCSLPLPGPDDVLLAPPTISHPLASDVRLPRQVSLYWFGKIWKFIGLELGQTEQRGAHEAPGRACPPKARPGGSWPPPGSSGPVPKLLVFILANKKSPKSFVAFGLRLVLIFCKTKTGQKTATGTGH